ncbi:hypothetical protein B1813_16785 [Saccharomonospora piscinae]|uniref:Uncharacterized protein n=1 Tax=Saccharomonospora piscinae TaxID=687388 RepID=A0A1V9A270_SACPI|nr:hypothetical protein [Saccharomonospora piscinae]OQO91143.1 hypothetical protein B1813_16785 [Saccharomonospora piscinae]
MHDRRHPGQEPTVVVDDPTGTRLPMDELVDGVRPDDPATDPHEPADSRPPNESESALARRAKLIALLVVMAALVISVIVASSIAADSDDSGGGTQQRERGITGAAALGGFTVPAGAHADAGDSAPPSSGSAGSPTGEQSELAAEPAMAVPAVTGREDTLDTPTITSDSGTADDTSGGDTHGDGEVADRTPSSGSGSERADRASVVRDFYQRMLSSPETALSLVAPDLVADERERLLASWRSMSTVTVEHVHEEGDGSVRVVVTLRTVSGTPLRITQLLTFSDGPQPVINHAALLSIRTL